jgi:hypothetical protein
MAAATGLRFRACDDDRPPDLDQISAEAVPHRSGMPPRSLLRDGNSTPIANFLPFPLDMSDMLS